MKKEAGLVRERALLEALLLEYRHAGWQHGKLQSPHHGLLLIMRRAGRLMKEAAKGNPARAEMAEQALQVAAVALKFLVEVCNSEEKGWPSPRNPRPIQ